MNEEQDKEPLLPDKNEYDRLLDELLSQVSKDPKNITNEELENIGAKIDLAKKAQDLKLTRANVEEAELKNKSLKWELPIKKITQIVLLAVGLASIFYGGYLTRVENSGNNVYLWISMGIGALLASYGHIEALFKGKKGS